MFTTDPPADYEDPNLMCPGGLNESSDMAKELEMEEELDEEALLYGDSDKLFQDFKKYKPLEEKVGIDSRHFTVRVNLQIMLSTSYQICNFVVL